MTMSKDSKQSLITIAAIAIVVLLGINAYLVYNKIQQDKLITQKSEEISDINQLKDELEKQYDEAVTELDQMKSDNEEANTLIEEQKAALTEQKNKISKMIRQGKSTKADFAKAKEQIALLRSQLDGYIVDVQKLTEEKEMLTQQTVQLTEEKTALIDEVEKERTMNQDLVTARAALVSEKEELEIDREALQKKVNIGSVVKTQNLTVQGYKVRKSGKLSKRSKARNIDRLNICFDATDNIVTEGGTETFHVRMVDPLGETLAIENLGSGVITNAKTGEQVRFSQAKEVEYSNQSTQVCLDWEPNIPFKKGEYQVEVFNKGYLAGTGNFKLK
ncbi:MAG: hypothetical protein AB8G15_06395 [Saprospiraceae bacterium]